jgi:hypothetical protein
MFAPLFMLEPKFAQADDISGSYSETFLEYFLAQPVPVQVRRGPQTMPPK